MTRTTHRGWTIEPAFIGFYGSHPNADEAFGVVHGNTVRQVRDAIDELIEEDRARYEVPLTNTGFFREIASIFQRDA